MPDLVASGKVREIYALDDERLLLVASDRVSTFNRKSVHSFPTRRSSDLDRKSVV